MPPAGRAADATTGAEFDGARSRPRARGCRDGTGNCVASPRARRVAALAWAPALDRAGDPGAGRVLRGAVGLGTGDARIRAAGAVAASGRDRRRPGVVGGRQRRGAARRRDRALSPRGERACAGDRDGGDAPAGILPAGGPGPDRRSDHLRARSTVGDSLSATRPDLSPGGRGRRGGRRRAAADRPRLVPVAVVEQRGRVRGLRGDAGCAGIHRDLSVAADRLRRHDDVSRLGTPRPDRRAAGAAGAGIRAAGARVRYRRVGAGWGAPDRPEHPTGQRPVAAPL